MTKKTDNQPLDFYGLSKEQQRVEVAKDVLKQLDLGRIRSRTGGYFTVLGMRALPRGPLQQTLEQTQAPCEVCALGALFYSQVVLGNGVTLRNGRIMFDGNELRRKLKQLFTVEQLELIERAFEGWSWNHALETSERSMTRRFREQHPEREDRLRLVMQNIIDNNGTFVLSALR